MGSGTIHKAAVNKLSSFGNDWIYIHLPLIQCHKCFEFGLNIIVRRAVLHVF